MSDLTDKDFATLFTAQRTIDRGSAPPFETVARAAAIGSTRLGQPRLAHGGLIVALAAAVVIAAVALVARSRPAPVPPTADVDISHWSPPTDVLLRMSRDALGVPALATSSLNTPTGN